MDRYFETLLGADATPLSRALVALLGPMARAGESCLDLSRLARNPEAREVLGGTIPSVDTLVSELSQTDAIARAVGATLTSDRGQPFVLDDAGRLYFRRLYRAECQVAEHLVRLMHGATPTKGALPRDRLDHYFPPAAGKLERDHQREAAEACLRSGVTLITGGPGTGKTTTVVKILALLIEEGIRERCIPKLLLLAPTGKAADRLLEAVRGSLVDSQVAPEICQYLPRAASTVHRALEAGFGRGARFRRGSESPLLADVVVVDEASMLDLSLMVHLLDALRSGTRLIFLGDPDQLASVDAGSVLADLLKATSELAGQSTRATISGVHLRKSYRFASDSGISGLARAVQKGDASAACDALFRGANPEVRWLGPSSSEPLARRTMEGFAERYRDLLDAGSPEECLTRLGEFRVLCAVRQGTRGVVELSRWITSYLHRASGDGSYFQGMPLLILRNDLRLGLFNGDVGVVWKTPTGSLAAHFVRGEMGLVRLPLAALPEHEPAFAMTVHKSQGSEYDEAAFVLPEGAFAQTLTREVIYTAVTRARRRVAVWGDEAPFRSGVERVTARASGLADRLTQLARSSSSTP